jgi:WD40 repeat protein
VSAHSSPARIAAEEVLRELIDARLLTSYEVREDEHDPVRRVEIIHESLLANWPRLVRWQTQDQEGAQLRDELRQAAKTWNEHDRTDDLLWTGTAYREFRLWQERYPGGLTEIEEAFASAMVSLANRRRRRRRIAVTAAFILLFLVLTVVGSLWRRSVVETRRAEAAGLLSQAQVELADYPTAAVAYAIASLELADSLEARRLAVEALWQGPTSFVVNESPSYFIGFAPNGRFLVQSTDTNPSCPIHVIDDSGGDEILDEFIPPNAAGLAFGAEEEFASFRFSEDQPVVFWSATEKRMNARFEIANATWSRAPVWLRMDDDNRLVLISGADRRITAHALTGDGRHRELGSIDLQPVTEEGRWLLSFPPGGRLISVSTGHDLFVIEIVSDGLSQPRLIGRQDTEIVLISSDVTHHVTATLDTEGRVRLWDMTGIKEPLLLPEWVPPDSDLRFTRDGSLLEARSRIDGFAETRIWALGGDTAKFLRHIHLGKDAFGGWSLNPARRQLASVTNPDNKIRLWSIRAPADAAPVVVRQGAEGAARGARFHPGGSWMATSYSNGLKLWPVVRDYPIVIDEYEERPISVVFGPEGDWVATCTLDDPGLVRVWSLSGESNPPARLLYEAGTYTYDLAASPDGNHLLLGAHSGGARYLSLEGESPEAPTLDTSGFAVGSLAFDPDGRIAAGMFYSWDTKKTVIKVWDLESKHLIGEWWEGDNEDLYHAKVRFLNSDALLVGVPTGGLIEWDPETGSKKHLLEASVDDLAVDVAGTLVLSKTVKQRGPLGGPGHVMVTDLASGETRTLASHGQEVMSIGIDRAGTVVASGDAGGVIRVGPITGEEPHLLLGSADEIRDLAIDPKGRWIASVSGTTLRLWPMPDLSKPPLHTLPREELIAKLKTLTNLRVVRDPESATGWTLTHDPFPGWETVPTW